MHCLHYTDFKSRTGATMMFKDGRGGIDNMLSKQKQKTSSSTTAELVGVDNILPLAL